MQVNYQFYAHSYYLTAYLPFDMATISTQCRTALHIDRLRWIFPQGVFLGAQGEDSEVTQRLVGHLNTRTVPRLCHEIKEGIITSSQQNESVIPKNFLFLSYWHMNNSNKSNKTTWWQHSLGPTTLEPGTGKVEYRITTQNIFSRT